MIIKDLNWENIVKDFILKHEEYGFEGNKIIEFMNSIKDDKDTNDITMKYIDKIIVNYYIYNAEPKTAYIDAGEYIYMWKSFFDYLKEDKLYVKSHILENQRTNVEEYISSVVENLKNGSSRNKYYIEMVQECLRQFKDGIEEGIYADRENYGILQSCILINFRLLTGESQKNLMTIKLSDIKDQCLSISGGKFIISEETNHYIEKYLKSRKISASHEYLFTKFSGEGYKNDKQFSRNIPSGIVLREFNLRGVIPIGVKSFDINDIEENVIDSQIAN